MRRAKVILVAALAIPLAGCVVGGKPKAVAALPAVPQPVAPVAPPEPLSIPQTQTQLPAPQPLDPDALHTAPPVETPTPVQPRPAPPPTRRQPPPVKPAEQPPAEPSRPPIQEILPAEQQRQLQASAQRHKAEIHALLAQLGARLTPAQRARVTSINQFVRLSDQAEKAMDMRQADEYAEKAHILAKELQSGR